MPNHLHQLLIKVFISLEYIIKDENNFLNFPLPFAVSCSFGSVKSFLFDGTWS